jgi:hypothetical protein
VFRRREDADGFTIGHFWGGEMNGVSADLMPIWTVPGVTPQRRGAYWYPMLKYRRNRPK